MTKYHIRPRIVTKVAALTIVPALAFAQAGSGSDAPGNHEQGSHEQGSQQQGSQSTTGVDDTSGMPQAPTAGEMDKTRAAIDPSEVQRVFGMDAALIEIGSLNTENVKKLQQSLKDRGHYPGQVDGVVGPQTRAALNAMVSQQFALTRRLVNEGKITGQLAASVGLNPEDITPVTGVDTTTPKAPHQPAVPPSTGQTPPSGNPPDVYPEGPPPDDSQMDDTHGKP